MARTNKMWILKKKQQQAKQKQLLVWKTDDIESVKKEYSNPKNNSYNRFFKSWKFFCDTTSVREDPDWYRILRTPNSWEINFEYRWDASYWFRRWIRKIRKLKR